MKKVFAIALVLCLVMGAVFAAKGDIKVGGQLGYVGAYSNQKVAENSNNYIQTKANVGGFGFEVGGLYDVTDEISVKAELGLAFFGKATGRVTTCIAGNKSTTDPVKSDEATPMRFTTYVGGQYAYAINKEFKVAGGAGLDIALGKESTADDAKTLFSLGVGAELTGSYAINKNIEVLLGARYSFFFVNSSETIKKAKKAAEDLGAKLTFNTSALRIFAGCTYKI